MMILKIFGAATVVVCCSLLGIRCAGAYSRRVKTLRALVGTLTVARSEICDLLSPMPELLEMLSKTAPAPARSFWRDCDAAVRAGMSFPEAWTYAAERLAHVDQKSRDVILALTSVMGRYDAEAQRDELTRAVIALEDSLREAEAERASGGRTCAALGVGVGVMLAIILV